MDIRQLLLAAFDAEHREHLDAIRAGLGASAEGRQADWNDVFRRAHSLKGAARAVDLPPVEALAHQLETLFERVSSGERLLDREAMAAIHLALDRIEAFVADTLADTGRGMAAMPGDALAALQRCLSEAPPPPAPDTRAAPPPERQPAAAVPPSPVPSPAPSPTPSSAPPPPPQAGEPGQAVLRVPAATVEALTRATHGLANALSGRAAIGEGLAAIAGTATALRRRVEAVRASNGLRHAAIAAPPDDRDTERRAAPAEEFAVLETALSALVRDALALARRQRANTAAIETASARVREETERLALVPAETAFGGFARSLREMARADGRAVEVTVRGLDLPVDRSTLQALRDPVLHALRNALGHGMEPPEARAAAGKPEALGVLFEVEARGSRLVIGIHDDGAGPDPAMIETRARERGLILPGQTIDATRLLALVFEPGFSTAAGLDTLSGRGIGLSVVAEAVHRLQGEVRLEPRIPHGASLVMDLPLSAARRSLLLVETGGQTYALPSPSAERLLRLDRAGLDIVAGRPMAQVQARTGASGIDAPGMASPSMDAPGIDTTGTDGRGVSLTLPVTELAALLGGQASRPATSFPAILLRAGGRRCLLAVDRLHDVRTLLVLPAPPIGADPGLVVGTVVLGSETPVLVLNPEGLIARAEKAVPRPAGLSTKGYTAASGTLPPARRSTILVVDDSITTRTLEKSILEAAGYRVVVCVDGQDALDRLRAGIEPVDLVVADVEMPRLDGFGLVAALRAETAFAALPVILMTSRGAAEDVARGLELGADAYLTKQKFDQRELLDTVGQLL